ncbi:MAG TPA: hypothetical protein VN259_04100 [Xanthomonadales bacterium]|nr:hypothetical protein [Xanthomonadales bacterium]
MKRAMMPLACRLRRVGYGMAAIGIAQTEAHSGGMVASRERSDDCPRGYTPIASDAFDKTPRCYALLPSVTAMCRLCLKLLPKVAPMAVSKLDGDCDVDHGSETM